MRRETLVVGCVALLLSGCGGRGDVAPGPEPAPVERVAQEARTLLRNVPVPDFQRAALEAATRSASGAPGPAYWQNEVSYTIEAELDPESATLTGSERIVYRNRSPNALSGIVLNLSQNVFSEGVPRNRYVQVTGGFVLDRVAVGGQTLELRSTREIPIAVEVPTAPAGYSVQGTLGRVQLPAPLQPGESVTLEIDWHHTIPPVGSFRTAWEDALGARAFQVAQWYPQVATYDDLHGWDATPYLGDGEFYLEYGAFDVSITVPAGYLVGATGELVNADEVLTEEARERLVRALESDSVTRIVTPADLSAENATQPAPGDHLTWRFTASDVRDFAFATSAGYVWDATRVRIADPAGGDRTVVVHSLYRPGSPGWEEAAEYGRHATEHISGLLIPYLYSQITISEGPISGMEYPMIVFIPRAQSPRSLYGVIAHEVAHEWFPMMVGTDEASYAWLDEGAATYLENVAAGDFFDDPDSFAADLAGYIGVAGTDREVPMMRHTDLVTPYGARTLAAYSKPGVLLRSLRAYLGEDRFREALNTFATEWLLKHPTPWDLFNTVERVSGEELDWFFHPWWFETVTLDQAIVGVEGAETGRAVVTVEDLGEIPAPALVFGVTESGTPVGAEIPVTTWLAGARRATVTLTADEPIVAVVIDPAQIHPDANFENNVWQAEPVDAQQ